MDVAAVSNEGTCHLFKLSLADQSTEPITAFSSVQFATEATKVQKKIVFVKSLIVVNFTGVYRHSPPYPHCPPLHHPHTGTHLTYPPTF